MWSNLLVSYVTVDIHIFANIYIRHLVVILKEVKFNTKYHRIVTGLLTGILTNQRTIFDYIVVRYVTIDKL